MNPSNPDALSAPSPEQMLAEQFADFSPWLFQPSGENHLSGYSLCGEKPAIQMLHGTGFAALSLAPLARQLQALNHREIWLGNLPGHGGTWQRVDRMPSWQGMAAQLDQAFSARGQTDEAKVVGIGHSLGAILTLLAAARNPERYSQLILLDPPLFSHTINAFQASLRATGLWKRRKPVRAVSNRRRHWPDSRTMAKELSGKSLYKGWHSEALAGFIASGSESDSQQGGLQLACDPLFEGNIFGSYPRGLWRSIKRLQVPTTILYASDSYSFIPSSVAKACKLNPQIKAMKFGQGHCFPMTDPEGTAQQIQQLLLDK